MKKFYERYLKNINIFLALGICLAAALCFAGFLFWASRTARLSSRQASAAGEMISWTRTTRRHTRIPLSCSSF